MKLIRIIFALVIFLISSAQTATPPVDNLVCPVGTPDPSKIIDGDFAFQCPHCFPTPTSVFPTVQIPSAEYHPEHAGSCTPDELSTSCYNDPMQNRCMCLGVEGEPTPTVYINPPPILPTPTPQSVHWYKVANNQTGSGSRAQCSGCGGRVETNLITMNNTKSCGSNDAKVGEWWSLNMVKDSYNSTSDGFRFWSSSTNYWSANWWDGTGDINITVTYLLAKQFAPGVETGAQFSAKVGLGSPTFNQFYGNWNNGVGEVFSGTRYWGISDADAKSGYNLTATKLYDICYGSNEPSAATPTPTPTITPMPGACSSYIYLDGDPVVTFPEVSIIQGSCITLIPAWNYIIPAFGELWDDTPVGWEGFSICPKWVSFEPVKVFDLEIPVELMVLPFVMFLFGIIIRL